MRELTIESRMKLHDIRDHMHVYAGRRHVKGRLRERLDELFHEALEALEEGASDVGVRQLLQEGRATFDEIVDHDKSMESAYDRIVSILLSSKATREVELLNLSALVREEVAYFHTDLRLLPADRLMFIAHFDPWIRGDRTRVRRLVANLLKNASEAVEGVGGGVAAEVDVAGVMTERFAVTGTIPPGNYATLTIRDEGAGLPREVVPSLFDPGFSEKEGHLGLGLAIVKEVLEESDAHLEFLPVEPRGTMVRVYFPLAEPPAAAHLGASEAHARS